MLGFLLGLSRETEELMLVAAAGESEEEETMAIKPEECANLGCVGA